MNDKKTSAPPPGMSVADIYYVLFRRKRLILGFSLAGILAALAFCWMKPPQYKSEAELSLSVLEAKPIHTVPGEEAGARNDPSESIIKTEVSILQSLDLAQQVVQAMTPETILAGIGGGSDSNRAADYVKKGLTVETTPDSSVIHIAFQHPDKETAQTVLSKIIDGYFRKHFEMQGGGVFGGFLTNETTRLGGQLAETDKQILLAQSQIGVITTDDAKDAYTAEITKFRGQISSAEEELAGRQAVLKVLNSSKTDAQGTPAAIVPAGQYDAYRRVCERLAVLSKKEDDYLTQQGFTEENLWVKDVRNQIAEAQKTRNQLQEKYPQLGILEVPLQNLSRETADMANDLPHAVAQVTGLKMKLDILHSQLSQVWNEAANFERVEATLSELQHKKAAEETSLKYFTDHLERSRIDEALNEGKASDISIIQRPTPPLKDWTKPFKKILGLLAAGGIIAGLGLAFVIELYLDRSIRRPGDIEIKLALPLLISIPDVAKNGFGQTALLNSSARLLLNNAAAKTANGGPHAGQSIAPWDQENPLRRYYQGLRDRLIVYFEVGNVVHHPKLVAVTSCGGGAGVSSIAAGLAATLSETDDGNVLLVNISGEHGAAQQFHKGELSYSLDEVLQREKKGALVKASLYSSVEQANGDMLPANLPKKLSALMPQLKASQYDYIIFDMPPVTPTTATARLSGLMDMVLLVIESEKTHQDVVTGAIQLLAESKATVSTVLNKSRSYIPAKLHQEFHSYV